MKNIRKNTKYQFFFSSSMEVIYRVKNLCFFSHLPNQQYISNCYHHPQNLYTSHLSIYLHICLPLQIRIQLCSASCAWIFTYSCVRHSCTWIPHRHIQVSESVSKHLGTPPFQLHHFPSPNSIRIPNFIKIRTNMEFSTDHKVPTEHPKGTAGSSPASPTASLSRSNAKG